MGPVRTCVGCRQHGPRSGLLRVVHGADGLTIDERKSLPGRGAWVHPDPGCISAAITRKAFVRALRVPADVGRETLEKRLNSYGNQVNGSK